MKLINKTNRMKVIPLPHQTYCKALGRCECIQLPGMKNKVATSLTIPAGATSRDVPDAVLSVTLVAKMLKKQQLEIEGKNETPSKAGKKTEKKPKRRRKPKVSEDSKSSETRK